MKVDKRITFDTLAGHSYDFSRWEMAEAMTHLDAEMSYCVAECVSAWKDENIIYAENGTYKWHPVKMLDEVAICVFNVMYERLLGKPFNGKYIESACSNTKMKLLYAYKRFTGKTSGPTELAESMLLYAIVYATTAIRYAYR